MKFPRFTRVSTSFSVPTGPQTASSFSRPFIDIDWTSPGSPRKWSPWKWVRNTREVCMKEKLDSMNCRCVPSPQSNRRISGPRFTAIADTFRFGVGHDPLVPRNRICTGRGIGQGGMNLLSRVSSMCPRSEKD